MSEDCRLRVLFVIGSMGGGGAERQMLEILWRLDRARFKPFLYLAMKQGELLSEVPPDVPIFAYWDKQPESWSRRFFRTFKLTRLLRYRHLADVLRREKIDLVYDRTYLATLDAAGGCWFRPTPRISCCVADPQPELEQHARFSIALARKLARRAYLSASIVLANSEGLRHRVLEYFKLPPEHVRVYSNLLARVRQPLSIKSSEALDEEDRSSSRSKPPLTTFNVSQNTENQEVTGLEIDRERHQRLLSFCGENKGSFLIVSAGRLHPQKGYHFLLEAINEVVRDQGRSSVRLVLFGQGESEFELQSYVQRHHLEEYVLLAGFDPDPRRWYPHAKLFVLPSLSDAMPNALIEAVVDGIPALATTCPTGPKEILADGQLGGLVPPGDPSALADAIVEAMDHYDQWKDRALVARDRVHRMFDPETGMQRLQELMERIGRGQ